MRALGLSGTRSAISDGGPSNTLMATGGVDSVVEVPGFTSCTDDAFARCRSSPRATLPPASASRQLRRAFHDPVGGVRDVRRHQQCRQQRLHRISFGTARRASRAHGASDGMMPSMQRDAVRLLLAIALRMPCSPGRRTRVAAGTRRRVVARVDEPIHLPREVRRRRRTPRDRAPARTPSRPSLRSDRRGRARRARRSAPRPAARARSPCDPHRGRPAATACPWAR